MAIRSRHTPGPLTLKPKMWHPRTTSFKGRDRVIGYSIMASTEVLAEVFDLGHDRQEEMEANGKLFAAAPELRRVLDPEMLEAIAEEIDCFEHSARAASLRKIAQEQRAAIASAEGSQ